MNTNAGHQPLRVARLAGALLLSFLFAACTAPGATNSPGPSASAGTAGATTPAGFYLRVSQTQALAPQYTFGWLPVTTIADGKFFDGMIAVPAIYPGPLYIGMSYQTISTKGIDAIVAEARNDGLLGTKTDFSEQSLAGAILCHLQMVVDGVTHELSGPCASGPGTSAEAPGSSAAYAAFLYKLASLHAWLGSELGPSVPYTPSRLAVLVIPPVAQQGGPITPEQKPWPLTTPFASFGSPFGSSGDRCAVVSGADLETLLPAVQAANQLTRFLDSQAMEKSLQVRVLLPGEIDPC
jgi:hypothetical protein